MIDHRLLAYAGTLAVFLLGALVVTVAALGAVAAVTATAILVRARRRHKARRNHPTGLPDGRRKVAASGTGDRQVNWACRQGACPSPVPQPTPGQRTKACTPCAEQ